MKVDHHYCGVNGEKTGFGVFKFLNSIEIIMNFGSAPYVNVNKFYSDYFQVKEKENPAINVILDMIDYNSTYRGLDKMKITYRQLLPDKIKFLYQYEGSLTTPNCSQNVLWNVIEERNYISLRQVHIN